MKKNIKRLFIIAAACVVTGITMGITALAIVNFDFALLSTNDQVFTEHTYERSAKSVESLDISDISRDVTIEVGDTDIIKVICFESEAQKYLIEQDGSTLKIKYDEQRRWWEYIMSFDYQIDDYSLAIYVPAELGGNLNVKTVNGDIDASDISLGGRLSASSTNGEIRLQNITSASADISTTSGEIGLSRFETGSIELSAVNGDITLSGTEVRSGMNASTVSGQIAATSSVFTGAVDASTTNGEITFTDCTVTKGMNASTISGEITLSLHGELQDFRIEASSVSGDINSPMLLGNGSILLDLSTTNGDITVDIIE